MFLLDCFQILTLKVRNFACEILTVLKQVKFILGYLTVSCHYLLSAIPVQGKSGMTGGAYFPFDNSGFAAACVTLPSLIALIKHHVGKRVCSQQ